MTTETSGLTPRARLAWPNLFEPRLNDLSGNVEYSCQLIIDKDDPGLAPMVEAVKAAIAKKWGAAPPKNLRKPFRDGDVDKEGHEDYEGKVFINMKSKNKPGVVDEQVQPIIAQDELMMGDWVRASYNAYAYDTKGNKGVAFGLRNVQRVGKGEPLKGGTTRAEDDFGAVTPEVSQEDAEALVDNMF